MNWEAIGAVGELLGALAVIATLIYLARQVRSSAKAMESQVSANLSTEMERLATALAQDEFLSEALATAQRGDELDAAQRLRLGWWYGGFMRVCESHFLQQHLKATELDIETPIAAILKGFAEVPYFHTFMRRMIENGTATKEFLSWLDDNVLKEEST